MKKLLYLLVALGILSALDHPVINQFYDDTIGQIKLLARDSAKPGGNLGAANIYDEMQTRFDRYSEAEKQLIKTITKDNPSVLKFQKDYCVNKDFNPVIYGVHKKEFCAVISIHEDKLLLIK